MTTTSKTTARPAGAKAPQDHKPKATGSPDSIDEQARFTFTDPDTEQQLVSGPIYQAATSVAIIEEFPNPEELGGYEQGRYMVKMLLRAYHGQPRAVSLLRNMTLDEVSDIFDAVEEQEGLTVGESSGSSQS